MKRLLPYSVSTQVANVYLVAAGISDSEQPGASSMASVSAKSPNHAHLLACFCLDAMDVLQEELHSAGLEPVSAKIGLHTGPLTAGLIGHSRCYYRIFGDTVNVASRMMSTGKVRTQVVLSFGCAFGFDKCVLSDLPASSNLLQRCH